MTDGTSARTHCGLQGTEAVVSDGEAKRDVSTGVVVAVADLKGIAPQDMEERLHDWVDPDALETFVDSVDDGHVAFDMADYRVRVESDGRVSVTALDDAGATALDDAGATALDDDQ